MDKSIGYMLLTAAMLAGVVGCKTSTNPEAGDKLTLITSEQDTTSIRSGPVEFTLTAIDPTGYGVSGAYIDFYDPIEQRARHEGPTPEDGTWQFTDTIPIAQGGENFEFGFVAERPGSITSDSVHLWLQTVDIRPWTIDSVAANSWGEEYVGVEWARPPIDKGIDTIYLWGPNSEQATPITVPYPENSTEVYDEGFEIDSISVHNTYCASDTIAWGAVTYLTNVYLYALTDSTSSIATGFSLSEEEQEAINSGDDYYLDFVIAADPNNSASGISLVSPSLSALTGFTNGRVTKFYHPVQYIDSGNGLRERFYTHDLSTYVNGVTPMYDIPLPDSSGYSTDVIVLTANGNYAQLSIGPISHDYANDMFVSVEISYQEEENLPYAGRGRKK